MNYQPEYGFTVSGRVRNRFANVPVKNSVVNIGIFASGKPLIGFLPTDSSGRFSLTGVDLTGEARLIASVTNEKDNLRGWLLLDSVRYNPAEVEDIMTQKKNLLMGGQFVSDIQLTTKNLHKYIQYVEFRNDFQKKYKLSDTIPLGEIKVVATRVDWTETAYSRSRHYLQGTPDHEYVIDPISEVYTNVSQFISSRIMNLPLSPHQMKNPLYLLDGVRVPESTVKNLPLKWVERIDVIDDLASNAGLRTVIMTDSTISYSDGTISIVLRSGYNASEPIFHSVNIKISGYDEPRIFYSPKHHTKLESDYKPDLRTTLFWKPDINIKNNNATVLNYFNADNSSRIRLVVEGVTSTGLPVTCKSEYEVK
jgi:hypothetical protein